MLFSDMVADSTWRNRSFFMKKYCSLSPLASYCSNIMQRSIFLPPLKHIGCLGHQRIVECGDDFSEPSSCVILHSVPYVLLFLNQVSWRGHFSDRCSYVHPDSDRNCKTEDKKVLSPAYVIPARQRVLDCDGHEDYPKSGRFFKIVSIR